jgi:hypothetical protein
MRLWPLVCHKDTGGFLALDAPDNDSSAFTRTIRSRADRLGERSFTSTEPSLKVQCHSLADWPIFSSDSCPTSPP